ncbi:ATP-binding protein [Amycolatopsis suaedae]|uniref:ATP-binding protein n=1 Tax=Amycolatopsis suaedae TaxID=2510978 RepID=A0A4Q7J3D0_9PSEU|nr:ATP-binding protein [Amycolatopsis suaedae]RZQ62001.1 ATP-binding protein [Amycolatopsis suaedae]
MIEKDPPPSDLGDRNDIEIRLGADLAHLPIIRGVASNIAMRADFDLDTIADLRLAVDEACSELITRATTGSSMRCRFTFDDDQLRFHGAVLSADRAVPDTGSFGWKVLTTLADEATSWAEADGTGHVVHIALAKRRPAVDA